MSFQFDDCFWRKQMPYIDQIDCLLHMHPVLSYYPIKKHVYMIHNPESDSHQFHYQIRIHSVCPRKFVQKVNIFIEKLENTCWNVLCKGYVNFIWTARDYIQELEKEKWRIRVGSGILFPLSGSIPLATNSPW